jgi:hypothetical protein
MQMISIRQRAIVIIWRTITGLILLLYLVASCSNPFGKQDTDFTPKDNEEAELIALYLSEELIAPNSLYNQVLKNLAAIRSTFGDDFEPINHISFTPPWIAGCLIIRFDDTTAQKIANDEYHAWDELNEKYQVTDTTDISPLGTIALYFEGRLHPWRLAELYVNLPGVVYTELNYRIGDFPNIYPRQTITGITYLFRNAWGDCPDGCIENEYWYFIFEGCHPIFIGHWAAYENPEEPNWWNEAKQNRELFYEW